MQLTIQHLNYTYEGSFTPVFIDLTFNVDTSWRLGLIARNGRGKTTLLRLLCGELACKDMPRLPVTPVRFPADVEDEEQLTLFVTEQLAPDTPMWRLKRELNQLELTEDALYRPWNTLSHGEQTKVQLAALFAREDVWPLIDEPTNHLDLHGRELAAAYLRKKDGFLLVSHDRAFMDACIDHVLALNRSDTWVMQGGYSTYAQRFEQQNEYEEARSAALKKDIAKLTESARKAAQWSSAAEKKKFHVPENEQAVVDRGYMGAKSAAMMKRATNTLKRRERAIEEKSALLHNVETTGELKLTVLRHPKDPIIRVKDAAVCYGEHTVAQYISFEVRQGDRIALSGKNGCGKSSVIKALCGCGGALCGEVQTAGGLVISYVPQSVTELSGSMEDFIGASQIDETLFKAILRNMDFGRELFEQPLERMSMGQKKKLLLARSLCIPAHLYVWDEPLNYLDVYSRVQIEKLIDRSQPTLLLVEHDRAFLQHVCTQVVELG